jgi:F0F1-type ATP synthase assembly protein I
VQGIAGFDKLLAMPETQGPEKRNFLVTMARYSQLAFVLPAATVIGWIIGLLLDKWLDTSWLYLVGLLLGIAAGFVELVRTALRSEKSGNT